MCRYLFNPHRQDNPTWTVDMTAPFESDDIIAFHRLLPAYAPTPLVELPGLADELGIGRLWVKDEAHRPGLKAFKVLGASYAIYKFLQAAYEKAFGNKLDITEIRDLRPDRLGLDQYTFCTATDGNHGRAVAWAARQFGHKAVIFVPTSTTTARKESILNEKARLVTVDGNYDDTVRKAAAEAEKTGWQIIADTAYPGYMEIPRWIMAGYRTMFEEIDESMPDGKETSIDIVFIPAGVGSLAATAAWYYANRPGDHSPHLVSVEPLEAAGLLASAESTDGTVQSSDGREDSMMAGLNCATPSLLAWPLIRDRFDLFLALPDHYTAEAMHRLYTPTRPDPRLVSGESGAAGLAGLMALLNSQSLKAAHDRLELNRNSSVLIINTEGDTDPDNFSRIISRR